MQNQIRNIKPYVGKVVLAGVTFCDAEGNEIEQRQFWRTIMGLGENGWIEIATEGKSRFADREVLEIPPVLQAADPGTYRLHSTGESVVNPDFTCTWRIYPPEVASEDSAPSDSVWTA